MTKKEKKPVSEKWIARMTPDPRIGESTVEIYSIRKIKLTQEGKRLHSTTSDYLYAIYGENGPVNFFTDFDEAKLKKILEWNAIDEWASRHKMPGTVEDENHVEGYWPKEARDPKRAGRFFFQR